MQQTHHRYTALDGLRGIAALAVMIYHFSYLDQQHFVFGGAILAVDLFFCLSGFVLAHAYHTRLLTGMPAREFLMRRLIRLFPAYAVGTLLGLAALLLAYQSGTTTLSLREILLSFVLNVAYLPSFFHHSTSIFSNRPLDTVFPLNNPSWSLFFEWVANIALLIFIVLERRLKRPRVIYWAALLVFGAALIVSTQHLGGAAGWSIYTFRGGFPRVLWGFFAGVMLYFLREHTSRLALPVWLLAGLTLAFMTIPHETWYSDYWLLGAALIPLVVASGAHNKLPPRGWQTRWCDYLGQLSYPIYCIHYPILIITSTLFRDTPHFYWVIGCAMVICVILSHLVLRYVEAPSQRYLKARFLR